MSKQKNKTLNQAAQDVKSKPPVEETQQPPVGERAPDPTINQKNEAESTTNEEVKLPVEDKEGLISRILSKVKAAPGAAYDAIKAIGLSIKNTVLSLWDKLKNLFSKEGAAEAAGKVRPIFAILTIGLIIGTGGYYAVVQYGAYKVIAATAVATVVCYGAQKMAIEDETEYSLGEAFGMVG
jgi:hypothetical protein